MERPLKADRQKCRQIQTRRVALLLLRILLRAKRHNTSSSTDAIWIGADGAEQVCGPRTENGGLGLKRWPTRCPEERVGPTSGAGRHGLRRGASPDRVPIAPSPRRLYERAQSTYTCSPAWSSLQSCLVPGAGRGVAACGTSFASVVGTVWNLPLRMPCLSV